jgi:RNA polymerase sigma-70 factor (ECF subfamily)
VPLRDDSRPDSELAIAAGRGDRGALEALLARHTDRVHGICRRVLTNEQDALDATQEALIAIARGIGNFDGRAQFTTWCYRVATNAALDEARRRGRRPVPAETLPDRGDTQPRLDERVADALDIDAALSRIPPEYRAALALRDLSGYDYAEIGRILDLPPGTVRSRISRGRAALAQELGNQQPLSDRPTPRSP